MNVYQSCPTFITPRFILYPVQPKDAPGLLAVYSDQAAWKNFNADNCTSDFRYTTLREMEDCIAMWRWSYAQGYFVRWTIREDRRPIGTVEMFRRESQDAFNGHGLLRLDLCPDRERQDVIEEITSLLMEHCPALFGTLAMATKARPAAAERCAALKALGFTPSASRLIGHHGQEYGDYWVRCLCH